MELRVYDTNFNWKGIIDVFSCLIWETKHNAADEMALEITTNDTEIRDLLKNGNVIYRDIAEKEAVPFFITENTFEDSAETGLLTYTANGFSPEIWLTQRITGCKQKKKGKVGAVLKEFIEEHAINPSKSTRKIPELMLDIDVNLGSVIEVESHYDTLYDLVVELLQENDLCMKCFADFKQKKFILKIFEGTDRTRGNAINKEAIFSSDFDNIADQSYSEDANDYKNYALVAGAGEGANRKTLEVFEFDGIEESGLARREVFIDARDISDKKMVGDVEQAIPLAEYNELLKKRGKEKLQEYIVEKIFDCNVLGTVGLQYKRDFQVGDKVSVENKRMKLVAAERITAIEETFDLDGNSEIKAKIGTRRFTLLDRL